MCGFAVFADIYAPPCVAKMTEKPQKLEEGSSGSSESGDGHGSVKKGPKGDGKSSIPGAVFNLANAVGT